MDAIDTLFEQYRNLSKSLLTNEGKTAFATHIKDLNDSFPSLEYRVKMADGDTEFFRTKILDLRIQIMDELRLILAFSSNKRAEYYISEVAVIAGYKLNGSVNIMHIVNIGEYLERAAKNIKSVEEGQQLLIKLRAVMNRNSFDMSQE